MRDKHNYVGEEAQSKRGVLNLKYPIEHGNIVDWEGMERILAHTFVHELKVDPAENPLLMTEAPLNSRQCRELTTQLMFETFQVPAFYLSKQAVLSLYASGRTTGMVLDSGDDVTHAVPIQEGRVLPHAIKRVDFAGRELTNYLSALLFQRGHSITNFDRESVRDMKEKLCKVALDYNEEVANSKRSSEWESHYKLPDGRSITMDFERFQIPEAMFNFTHLGKEAGGWHNMIYESIMGCDVNLRSTLYSNIVLSGGNTMFPGVEDRLFKEISTLVDNSNKGKVKITASPKRKISAWIGGSIFSSLPDFHSRWISVEEYEEIGPASVHQKCYYF